jgi:hypothetical protein
MWAACGWIASWIVFGRATTGDILGVAAVALSLHLFVLFYEETTLRGKFGADYPCLFMVGFGSIPGTMGSGANRLNKRFRPKLFISFLYAAAIVKSHLFLHSLPPVSPTKPNMQKICVNSVMESRTAH